MKNEVHDIIESDSRLTVCKVAEKYRDSKTTIHEVLTQDLNISRVYARWDPKILTCQRRVEFLRQFITKLAKAVEILFRIVTTDENWFQCYDPETKHRPANGM